MYPKLVRDKIPRIIAANGSLPVVHTAGPDEYRTLLRSKLEEEVAEFLAAASPGEALEELADVAEVLLALAASMGAEPADLEVVRARKRDERGAFTLCVVLDAVKDGDLVTR